MTFMKEKISILAQKFPKIYCFLRNYLYVSKHVFIIYLKSFSIIAGIWLFDKNLLSKIMPYLNSFLMKSFELQCKIDTFKYCDTSFAIQHFQKNLVCFCFFCSAIFITFVVFVVYRLFNHLYVAKNITIVRDGTWKSDAKFIAVWCAITCCLNLLILFFGVSDNFYQLISTFFVSAGVFYFLLYKECFSHGLRAAPLQHTAPIH